MKTHLTPRQLAQALGVGESSVKRWCDRGLIRVERTAGGHRRLPRAAVVQFLRDTRHELAHPELLGLPAAATGGEASLDAVLEEAVAALEAGDEERLRAVGFHLYVAGVPACEICDEVLAPAFHRLGEKWQHGAVEIYQERQGTEICLRLLHELLAGLPPVDAGAPWALGGTLAGDWYSLPTTMVELVLREAGWNARSLGSSQPPETLAAALVDRAPRLFWLSISHVPSEEEMVRGVELIYRAARRRGAALVLGGRALTDRLRARLEVSSFCDDMSRLRAFVAALEPSVGREDCKQRRKG